MKVAVAQVKPVTGDISANIAAHRKFIDLAAEARTEFLVFPELSLTGYEPSLAKALATTLDDPRLEEIQILSNARKMTIGAGIPVKTKAGICISMILFQPGKPRDIYSKKYLHPDEDRFFVSGESFPVLPVGGKNVALAICYEISVGGHADDAFRNGAEIYVASVAKFVNGIDRAVQRLSDVAREFFVPVLMANAVGPAAGGICAGRSSVWRNGKMAAQLDNRQEGIIVFDTRTLEVTSKIVPS